MRGVGVVYVIISSKGAFPNYLKHFLADVGSKKKKLLRIGTQVKNGVLAQKMSRGGVQTWPKMHHGVWKCSLTSHLQILA